jgi:hypothetical protein
VRGGIGRGGGGRGRPARIDRFSIPAPPPSQLSVLAGGAVGALRLRVALIAARRAQKGLVDASEVDGGGRTRRRAAGGRPRVAVDAVFARRLKQILAM